MTDDPQRFRAWLDDARARGLTVGLHPTMGALHGGHTANIRRAAAECGVAAVTIFVNPLQFGEGEDFGAYPRPRHDDLARAEAAGAAYVLAPSPTGMFPEPPETSVTTGALGRRWEGEHRPGHFDGVATIVTKLLSLAGPCYAYFGEKDYQQLVIVRHLVADLSLPAVVVPCAVVRQPDGLALSSRNAYLDDAEREVAPTLYWALLAGKRALERGGPDNGRRGRQAMLEVMASQSIFSVDYAEVVDPIRLEPVMGSTSELRLLLAARCPSARLIDNLGANQEEG